MGADYVSTDLSDVEAFAMDWWYKYCGSSFSIVRPATIKEVAKTVQIAARHGLSIITQGGNTGLAGDLHLSWHHPPTP